VWLRLQAIPQLGGDYLYDTDSFRFYRQARIIDEQGALPERDMQRWLPIGRDLTTYLSLHSYLLAYATKTLRLLRPATTVYDAALYYPVAAFLLTLPLIYGLCARAFGRLSAWIAVVLVAVLPPAVGRSVAGYADRDALCLLLGAAALYCYARREQASSARATWAWTFLSALAALLLGLAWEGAGVFIAIVAGAELVRFLSGRYGREEFTQYVAWFAPVLAGLLLFTRAYRATANVSSPFAVVTLGVPLGMVVLAGVHLRLRRMPRAVSILTARQRVPSSLGALLWGVALLGAAFAVLAGTSRSFFDFLLSFSANVSSALGRSRLMESVGELQDVPLQGWLARLGPLYVLAALGGVVMLAGLARSRGSNPWALSAAFLSLIVSVLYHGAMAGTPYERLTSALYTVSLAALAGVFVHAVSCANRQDAEIPPVADIPQIIALLWFLVALVLTRGANRYEFFLAPPAAMLGGHALAAGYAWVRAQSRLGAWRTPAAALGLAAVLLGLVAVPPLGGYAVRSYAAVRALRPLFDSPDWRDAFAWMRDNLPHDAVIAADWSYGSHINVLTGRATVVDEDHFLPYWIHLNARHVLCAGTDREAIEFLHTRGATHLLLSARDISHAGSISAIASDGSGDRAFDVAPMWVQKEGGVLRAMPARGSRPRAPLVLHGRTYDAGQWEIMGVTVPVPGPRGDPPVATVSLRAGRNLVTMPLRRVHVDGREHAPSVAPGDPTFPGVLVLGPSKDRRTWQGVYVSEEGYGRLLVRLFLLGHGSPHFRPVYPSVDGEHASVQVWEIRYPPDVRWRTEYLTRDFADPRLRTAWMFGTQAGQ
jgi:asparagine N-glycosylation enzyme membrane subunit Stt3